MMATMAGMVIPTNPGDNFSNDTIDRFPPQIILSGPSGDSEDNDDVGDTNIDEVNANPNASLTDDMLFSSSVLKYDEESVVSATPLHWSCQQPRYGDKSIKNDAKNTSSISGSSFGTLGDLLVEHELKELHELKLENNSYNKNNSPPLQHNHRHHQPQHQHVNQEKSARMAPPPSVTGNYVHNYNHNNNSSIPQSSSFTTGSFTINSSTSSSMDNNSSLASSYTVNVGNSLLSRQNNTSKIMPTILYSAIGSLEHMGTAGSFLANNKHIKSNSIHGFNINSTNMGNRHIIQSAATTTTVTVTSDMNTINTNHKVQMNSNAMRKSSASMHLNHSQLVMPNEVIHIKSEPTQHQQIDHSRFIKMSSLSQQMEGEIVSRPKNYNTEESKDDEFRKKKLANSNSSKNNLSDNDSENKSPTSCIPSNDKDVASDPNTPTMGDTATSATTKPDTTSKANIASAAPIVLKPGRTSSSARKSKRSRKKKSTTISTAQPEIIFRPSSDAYTPRINAKTKPLCFKPASQRAPEAIPTTMGTISRPNFRDALRRVAMILQQHVAKIEHRFETGNVNDGLFSKEMLGAFKEDNFAKPRYRCTMVRVPMARAGVVYSLKRLKADYELRSSNSNADENSANDNRGSSSTTKVRVPTEVEIYDFAHQLFKKVQLSSECSIVCLIYIERLMETAKVPLMACTWRPIFMAGLLLASKVWQDLSSWNIEFASVYPQFSLDAINRLESQFLKMVKWDLYISSSLYAKYYFALRSLLEKKTFRQRYNSMLAVGSVNASDALKVQKRTEKVKEDALLQLSRSM